MRWTPPNPELFDRFVAFAREQVTSWDIDPTYPVLRYVYEREGLSEEIRLWRTLLYVTLYHLGSAEILWQRAPTRGSVPPEIFKGLPTGIERRGFRGRPRLAAESINGVLEAAEGNLTRWVGEATQPEGEAGWSGVRATFQAVKYQGSWASYKWADLLKWAHGYPITASDLGVGGGGETAGPIPGLVKLTGLDWKTCAKDNELQRAVLTEANAKGAGLNGLDQLETALCDFNSHLKGRYYVGHDIDMQAEQLRSCGPALWEARAVVLPARYLKERRR